MKYVFNLPKKYSFKKVGIKGRTFPTQELSDEVEFSIIETEKGHQTKIIEKECIFSYFILEGEGVFEINNELYKCKKGNLVMIPRGTAFRYNGKMKMLLTCNPWWFEEQEITL